MKLNERLWNEWMHGEPNQYCLRFDTIFIVMDCLQLQYDTHWPTKQFSAQHSIVLCIYICSFWHAFFARNYKSTENTIVCSTIDDTGSVLNKMDIIINRNVLITELQFDVKNLIILHFLNQFIDWITK